MKIAAIASLSVAIVATAAALLYIGRQRKAGKAEKWFGTVQLVCIIFLFFAALNLLMLLRYFGIF